MLPFTDRNDFGTHGQNNFNVVDYRPLSRASLEVLRQWVVEGIEPPVSAYPRLDDGTAVPRETVLATLEQVPGYSIPPAESLPTYVRPTLEVQHPEVSVSFRRGSVPSACLPGSVL